MHAYNSPSADDQCVLYRKDTVVVSMLGTEAAFEILNVMEYSSARGRMSVIAKSPSGSVRLLSKGSDTKIINILQKGSPKALLDATNSNLHLFATQVRRHADPASLTDSSASLALFNGALCML